MVLVDNLWSYLITEVTMDEAAPMLQHSGRLDDAAAVHGNDLAAVLNTN
jgi:hypothetical protein